MADNHDGAKILNEHAIVTNQTMETLYIMNESRFEKLFNCFNF